jgi:hypothetical protein
VHQQKVKVAYLASEGTIDEEEEPGMSSMMTNGDTSVGEPIMFVCTRAHLSTAVRDRACAAQRHRRHAGLRRRQG